MICRFLEKTVEIGIQEIQGETGNDIELEYYLIESIPDDMEEEKEYGVQIVEKHHNSIIESEMFKNVYNCRASVENLIRKLVYNTVTPVTLSYILDDILGCE